MNLGVLGAGKTKFHIVLPAMMNRLGVILYSITFLIGGGLFMIVFQPRKRSSKEGGGLTGVLNVFLSVIEWGEGG